jgi:hypothetical protein
MNSRTFGRVLLLAFLPVLAYGLYNYYQFTHGLRWRQADAPGAHIAALRACPVCADQFPATTVNSQQDDQAHQATDRHPPAHTLQSAQRRV